MTEEGFCCLNILIVELEMSSEDFVRALSFCQLKVALTKNNFSSVKITSFMFVPVILLRRNFTRASLCFFECIWVADDFKSDITSNLLHCLLTSIHVVNQCHYRFFGLCWTHALTALMIFGIWANYGLLIRGQFLLLWSSLKLLCGNSWSRSFKKLHNCRICLPSMQ